MIEKGLISHLTKIFMNKKLQISGEAYNIYTNLMIFFNEILKFVKMAKNNQLFS